MKFLVTFKEKWIADTPIIAKWIRNITGSISAAVPTAWLTFQTMGIQLPEWFVNNVGYITLISLIITGIAGTREVKNV